jgi:hypothetical protein
LENWQLRLLGARKRVERAKRRKERGRMKERGRRKERESRKIGRTWI